MTPKISIVTVTFNCADTVERTIRNVLEQTYPNIEYIVIDGASTDGTREIIERYADRLAYFVSEPDRGIYDAMNKGIKAATGEWILFRNSGDYFFKKTTVEDVFEWYAKNSNGNESLITGGLRCFCNDGYFDCVYDNCGNDIWKMARFPHPSTFIKLSLHKENLYHVDFKISGDYFLFQKLMLEHVPYAVYPDNISLFDNESGVSSRNKLKGLHEIIVTLQQLGAPKQIIKKMERSTYYNLCAIKIISILKKWNFTRNIYYRWSQPNWVKQSIEKTLSNV